MEWVLALLVFADNGNWISASIRLFNFINIISIYSEI